MESFIDEDFLLAGPSARELYHGWARDEPILDYHNHLPPEQVADNISFNNLAEVWLGGDHYKWRQMRTNGVPEALITGQKPGWESFQAWAAVVPKLLGNPLYHWTHLELKRYFGIEETLNPASAARIWDQANSKLQSSEFTTQGLLAQRNVRAICTTDDPADDLAAHRRYRGPVVMVPTFRPDRVMAVTHPDWVAYLGRLGQAADLEIRSLADLKTALNRRHLAFHEVGCRLSDHGLTRIPTRRTPALHLESTFASLLAGKPCSEIEIDAVATEILYEVGRLNAQRGWTMQLHLGPQRSLNSRMFQALGPDSGFDAMGDGPLGRGVVALFDALTIDRALPRTILYTINPVHQEMLATIAGSFQDGTVAGKIQLGAAWWFNDHMDGMELQLRTLANHGTLARFVGMLTDSRSFLSFSRHEYFRRVLSGLMGGWMDRGLVPKDFDLVGGMVRDICYSNARDFFRIPGVV